MVLIGLLALVIFGPHELPKVAWDLGKFVFKARTFTDEFKRGLALEETLEGSRERREPARESKHQELETSPKSQEAAVARESLEPGEETIKANKNQPENGAIEEDQLSNHAEGACRTSPTLASLTAREVEETLAPGQYRGDRVANEERTAGHKR